MLLLTYFQKLYRRTMDQAYGTAFENVASALRTGGRVLDCGANTGGSFHRLHTLAGLDATRYTGIEWNEGCVD